jgi:hypothetical protein
MADAKLTFLPWLRRGLAADLTPTTGERAQLALTVSATLKTGDTRAADVTLPLAGPGEVIGLDARTVLKMTPGAGESDAELRHFATLEVDQADLPWRYSPAVPNGQQLAPWIVLLVIEDEVEGTVAPATPQQRLPVLTVTSAAVLGALDLTASWAWAHVQLNNVAATPEAVRAALGGPRGTTTVRLLSPRRLEARKAYRACLVPAFARGRLAGLGREVTGAALDAAWTATTPVPFQLPVYHQWTFQTGVVGGFQDLARAIVPRKLSADVGRRAMDVSQPGFGMPSGATDGTLDLGGALQSIPAAAADDDANPAREAVAQAFVDELEAFLKTSQRQLRQAGVDKVVAPPLYGRWHAAVPTPPDAANPELNPATNRKWFYQLNTDPRNRVGAGLGTTVVQQHDQALVGSAWEQVGSLRDANQQRRLLQLGREALSRGWLRHVRSGRTGSFLQLTSLLHGQVLSGGAAETLRATFARSLVGLDVLEPHWRRLARPRGRLGRLQGRATALPAKDPLELLNDGFQPAPEPPTPDGMATVPDVLAPVVPGGLPGSGVGAVGGQGSDRLVFWGILLFCVSRKLLVANHDWPSWWLLKLMRFGLGLLRIATDPQGVDLRVKWRDGTLNGSDVRNGPKLPGFQIQLPVPTTPPAPPVPGPADSAQARDFRAAWAAALDFGNLPRLDNPVRIKLDFPTLTALLDGALHPRTTLPAWLKQRFALGGLPDTNDPLEPIQAAPEFPQPMWEPLRDLSPEWILPGLDAVETNTAALAVPNQRFIEAYMVGLNHEMARELLWNAYPTDQRGSYFRQFWDVRGFIPGPNDPPAADLLKESLRDIGPIHGWGAAQRLGTNSPRRLAPRDYLVLVLRGELIHRYPNVVVYAAQAAGTPARPTGPQRFPAFSGRMGADAAFYGFDLSQAAVRGTAGSAADPGYFFVLQEQPAEPRFDGPVGVGVVAPADVQATNAAEFAQKTFRTPTRVAIHGARMLPSDP